MRRSKMLGLVVITCAAPSCIVYDAALLDEAGGGVSAGDGDGTASGGSPSGGSAGGGDAAGGGGQPDETGGAASGGSLSGVGGNNGSGNSAGMDGGGGTGGTGGTENCAAPSGTKGPLVDVAETSLIEDFDRAWSSIGSGAPYTGQWFVAQDMSGTGISTKIQDAYQDDPCAAPGDTSLHVEGTGYVTWGASFDANLMFDVAEVDVSAFTGVTFFARSDDFDQLKLGFSDEDESNGEVPIESAAIFIESTWTQYWVVFPPTVSPERLTVVHVVASADDSFDFWMDDLAFYKAL